MMLKQSRRTFVKNGLIVAGSLYPISTAGAVHRFLDGSYLGDLDTGGMNPDIKGILKLGVDAAMVAGASYADCRFTYTRTRTIFVQNGRLGGGTNDSESITVGIRSLVNGYWGFAAGTLWDKGEIVRLAHESVSLAAGGAATGLREVTLADRSILSDSSWVTPIEIDPFDVHPAEVLDRLGGLAVYTSNIPMTGVGQNQALFNQQNKHFLASDGCSFSQKTYLSNGVFVVGVSDGNRSLSVSLPSLGHASVGFELFNEARLREEVYQASERLKADLKLPVKPIDVGRYDTLIGAEGMANILSGTIGAATEIDRVLGHEANATGTSYLKDPKEELSKFAVGNELLNVRADRDSPGGAATVKWDDEGVLTGAFQLVEKGVIKDFQTNREGAGWAREGYEINGIPFQSRGCAFAPQAVDPVAVHTANMVINPAEDNSLTEVSLMNDIADGIYFPNLGVTPDFQQLSIFAFSPICYEIKKGKKTAFLVNAGTLFRTPEFWKSVTRIGGPNSTLKCGIRERKGEPAQTSYHSITAVPSVVKDLSVIDIQRKA